MLLENKVHCMYMLVLLVINPLVLALPPLSNVIPSVGALVSLIPVCIKELFIFMLHVVTVHGLLQNGRQKLPNMSPRKPCTHGVS